MALEQKPEQILVALFLTNDLDDICRHALRSDNLRAQAKELGLDTSLCPDSYNPKSSKFSLSRNLSENVALYSALRVSYVNYRMGKMIDRNENSHAVIINDGMQRTIIHDLAIKRNAPFVDLKIPHIAKSYDLLKKYLKKAKHETQSRNIRFGVLLIPSKERVFYRYLKEKGYTLSNEYEQLVANDDKLRINTLSFMQEIGVSSTDVLPAMENAIRRHRNVYPPATDGHPIEVGYQIIAEAAEKLTKNKN